jgi:hypothetical protein
LLIARCRSFSFSNEGLDVGMDAGSAVHFTYRPPFTFIGKATVELK